MASDETDEQLVARLPRGDEGAFTELMRRHEDRIFGLALSITGDRNDALEATQETFLTLWRKADSFRGSARFSTWLYRIGINASRDQLRRRARQPVLDDEPSGEAAPFDPTETVPLRVDLRRALERLPDEYREAVVMHDLGDIPYEDIAHITGVALGTVKSRISRGRRLLAQSMEPVKSPKPSKDMT